MGIIFKISGGKHKNKAFHLSPFLRDSYRENSSYTDRQPHYIKVGGVLSVKLIYKKMFKKIAYATASALLVASPVMVPLASADGISSSSSLGTAAVLSEIDNRQSVSSLGNLFVLDRLFGGGTSVLGGGGIFGGNRTNLGDLFILDQLFGGGSVIGDGGIFGGGIGTSNSLGDLFVLDRLFGGSNDGIFGRGQTNLGNLFILDQLFSR
ncbi:hypothetical protein HYT00_02450 [Candidatus Giovannonibacteria bacterium]|nr:hypothetical protein [Candidatus Giovannonibacteria bacterium]